MTEAETETTRQAEIETHRQPTLKISKISKTNPLIIYIKQSLNVMYVAAGPQNLMNVTVSGYSE